MRSEEEIRRKLNELRQEEGKRVRFKDRHNNQNPGMGSGRKFIL